AHPALPAWASSGACAAAPAARHWSRASRGGQGKLWPPRDARDVREIQGRSQGRGEARISVTGPDREALRDALFVTKTPRTRRGAWRVAGNVTGPHAFRDGDPGPKTRWGD